MARMFWAALILGVVAFGQAQAWDVRDDEHGAPHLVMAAMGHQQISKVTKATRYTGGTDLGPGASDAPRALSGHENAPHGASGSQASHHVHHEGHDGQSYLMGGAHGAFASQPEDARSDDAKHEGMVSAVSGVLSQLTQLSLYVTSSLIALGPIWRALPGQCVDFYQNLTYSANLQDWVSFIIVISLTIVAVVAIELVLQSMLGRKSLSAPVEQAPRGLKHHAYHVLLLLRALVPPLCAYLVVVGLLLWVHDVGTVYVTLRLNDTSLMIALYWALATFLMRGAFILTRALFLAEVDGARWVLQDDPSARMLRRWILGLAVLVISSGTLLETLLVLGLPHLVYMSVLKLLGAVVVVICLRLAFGVRFLVASWIRHEPALARQHAPIVQRVIAFIADTWHLWTSASAVILYMQWALSLQTALNAFLKSCSSTVLILILTKMARLIVTNGFHHVEICFKAPIRDALQKADSSGAWHASLRHASYLDAFIYGVIYSVALLGILEAWNISLLSFLQGQAGAVLLNHFVTIGLILFMTLTFWEVIEIKIHKRLLDHSHTEGDLQTLPARFKTLLMLLQNVLKSTLALVAGVLMLAELGVNITVIAAGFGVVGIAFAMGSQRLIQDFVMGIIILLDQSLEIGEVVMIGGIGGKIQSFSIRSVRLLSHDGLIHIVPYSQIESITAFSDRTMTIIEVEVATDVDLDTVLGLIREAADDMRADPDQSPRILSDLAVFGMTMTSESMMQISAEIVSEADLHKQVEREFRLRVHRKLIEHRIQMPQVKQSIAFAAADTTNGALPILLTQTA